MHLECPHCQFTPTVQEWNECITSSIVLGVATQEIPESEDKWDEYQIQNGSDRVDCPNCEEVCTITDLLLV